MDRKEEGVALQHVGKDYEERSIMLRNKVMIVISLVFVTCSCVTKQTARNTVQGNTGQGKDSCYEVDHVYFPKGHRFRSGEVVKNEKQIVNNNFYPCKFKLEREMVLRISKGDVEGADAIEAVLKEVYKLDWDKSLGSVLLHAIHDNGESNSKQIIKNYNHWSGHEKATPKDFVERGSEYYEAARQFAFRTVYSQGKYNYAVAFFPHTLGTCEDYANLARAEISSREGYIEAQKELTHAVRDNGCTQLQAQLNAIAPKANSLIAAKKKKEADEEEARRIRRNELAKKQEREAAQRPAPSGNAQCDHLYDMCKSMCENTMPQFRTFVGQPEKMRCENDCYDYKRSCEQNDTYLMNLYYCKAMCEGSRDRYECEKKCKR